MISSKTIEIIALGKDQASKVLGGVGKSVSGLGSIAAGVAVGGLALAAAAVVGLGVAAVGTSLAITRLAFAAAEVEGTRETFRSLTEDIGGQAAVMQLLREETDRTISKQDLMYGSNKLLGMGIAETSEELATHIGYATTLGMAYGDNEKALENWSLMMANQSLPRMDSFGMSSGIARDRIKELMAATEGMTREQAFMIAVMEQADGAIEKVGDQYGTAAATTMRWRAAIDDLKLGIGQAFIPALEAIRGPALALVDEYGPKIIAWAEVAGEWLAEKIPEAVERLGEAWAEWWPKITGYASDAWERYSPFLIGTWEWLREKIPAAIQWLGETWAEWWPKIFGAAKDPLGTINDLFERLSDWLKEKIPTQLATLQTVWVVAWEAIQAVGDVFVEVVWPTLQEAFASLTEALEILGLDWGDVWEAIKRSIKITAIIIGTIILALVGVFTGLVTAIARVAAHIAGVLADMASTFRLAMKAIENILVGFFNIFIGIFTGNEERIKEGWETWLTGMGQMFRATWEGIVNFFRLTFGTIFELVAGFVEGVARFFINLYERLVGHSIVQDMMNELVNLFSSGFNRAIAFVVGLYNRMRDAGRHILSGLTAGILQGMWAVRDAIIRGIQDAINAAKAHLGIHSPSKVFEGFGQMAMKGFAKGIAGTGGEMVFGGMTLAGAGGMGGVRTTTIQITNHFGPGSVRDDQDILEIANAITQNLELRGVGPVL